MKRIFFLILLLFSSVFAFSQSRNISEMTKKRVFARDGGACQCCGSASNLEYDHIMPFSCGGTSDVSNIQLLCMRCNRSKSNSCVCKIHNKTVGINCCNESTTRKVKNNSQQCTGITKKGARCKKRATQPNGRCHLH